MRFFDAPTTSHNVLSVCARTFIEIDPDSTKNMINMQYATPRPWHVLILWSSDNVISYPSHLVIIMFHIHIIIPMQVPFQFLESIARNTHIYPSLPCEFSPINPSIISSSFYTSSLPWFYLQNLEGKPRNIWKIFLCSIDPSPLKIRLNIHSKSSFEFNEVN
jgi:hypothetical protein